MVVGLLDEGKLIEKVRARDADEGIEDYEKIARNGVITPSLARGLEIQGLGNWMFAYC